MEKYKAEGQIVKSYAGRDKGRFFVVLKTEDKFALIADGKVRKVDNPKRKKWMHLKATKANVQIPEGVTNKDLRRLLSSYNNQVVQKTLKLGADTTGTAAKTSASPNEKEV